MNTPSTNLRVDQKFDSTTVFLGKVIFGLGIVGIVLWLSPYSITELLTVVGLPLLILAFLIGGTGIAGSGFMDMINRKDIGSKVQEYVKAKKQEVEDDWDRSCMAQ